MAKMNYSHNGWKAGHRAAKQPAFSTSNTTLDAKSGKDVTDWRARHSRAELSFYAQLGAARRHSNKKAVSLAPVSCLKDKSDD